MPIIQVEQDKLNRKTSKDRYLMDREIINAQEIHECMKRCSASFIIRKMHRFIHFSAISVPVPPVFSILLLRYFSFFAMMSRALSPSGGAAGLWNSGVGSPTYLLNFHFCPNLPPPPHPGMAPSQERGGSQWGISSCPWFTIIIIDSLCSVCHLQHIVYSLQQLYGSKDFHILSTEEGTETWKWSVTCLRSPG